MDEEKEAKKAQEQRNAANNTETLRNAADVAIASKVPHAVAAGAAVKAADKLTGGAATDIAGKGLAKANQVAPGGNLLQGGINGLNESGLGQKAGQVARISARRGGVSQGSELAKQPTGNNMDTIGRGRDEPSSSLNSPQVQPGTANGEQAKEEEAPRIAGIGPFGKQPGNRQEQESSNQEEGTSTNSFSIFGSREARVIAAITLPFFGLLCIVLILAAAVSTLYGGNFEDALGAGQASGEDTGTSDFYPGATQDAQDYYDRINDVKLTFQAQGKTFDSLDIVSVFHVLIENGANLEYKTITTDKITEVASALFNGSTYDKEGFKEKLKNQIIPKYLPNKTSGEVEDIVAEIDQYISDYNDYIERSVDSSSTYGANACGTTGSCQYDIKGFFVNGTNVAKSMQVSNLKVRLMQCGSPYGNGKDTTPINQDLVDFENYAGGVAYAEIGDGQPIEAYKAQLVMARSFALSRPTAMGNARGLKLSQENNGWVLQIASCVSDQVFCNIDKGCSYMGGGDGQGGWVASGTDVAGAARTRSALSGSSPLRQAMVQTQGEVLTNNQGYIIAAGYNSNTQNQIASMANSGLDYKQILFKVYSNAKNIDKMTCSASTNCRVSTGEFANWKQCGASWSNVPIGTSGSNICGIGCLVTSVSMLIAKSGVQTSINNFNPGTFVEYLNANGGFYGGNFSWPAATGAAPSFKYQGKIGLNGLSREQKLAAISNALNSGSYLACEVKGTTGQHWVAVDSVSGNDVMMLDPGSGATNMWQEYNWANTSECGEYKIG